MKNRNSFLRISLLSVLTYLLFCSTSFAGWELLQNSPTTNDLHSVCFVNDNTGWIAGYNNTIFKTTNSGDSWEQQTSPAASNFECITFIDANTGWACGSGGTVIKTTNGGINWFSQTFTVVKLNSMDFIDANIGFICGDNGIIWKTINGGGNWLNQPTGMSQNLHEIRFFNSDTGFAVGDNAYILRTINSGNSWDIKSGPGIGSQIFYSVDFHNNTVVAAGTLTKRSTDNGENWNLGEFPLEPVFSSTYSGIGNLKGVGANGYLVITYNHGMVWIQQESPTNQNLYSIIYADISSSYWAVGSNGTILKNVPVWKNIFNNSAACYGMDFINSNTGWVVGITGLIKKTTNGGANWIIQSPQVSYYDLYSVYFTDANTGFAVGEFGEMEKTTNGGTNWSWQNSGDYEDKYSVYFIDANTGYIIGSGGKILKTTNTGTNWIGQNSQTSASLHSVCFADANTGYIAGSGGTILKTTNSGTNWIAQTPQFNGSFLSVYFTDGNTGYAVGDQGTIMKTTNGGTSWIGQVTYTPINFTSVYFLNADVGYVCGGEAIYKTHNGGHDWVMDDLGQNIVNSMQAVEFIVENNTAFGFAVGNKFFRTSFEYLGGEPLGNSGNYPGWVGLNSGTSQHIGGVDYINPFIAFAVGMRDPPGTGTGTILRTINGGQSWVRQASGVNAEFGAVSFSDVNNGIAVGYPSFIVHTTNSGANWVQQTSPTGSTLIDVDMFDASHAFICGDNAILYTSNGGDNWQLQNIQNNPVLVDIDYINQTTATTVGASGLILRTTNTGANWFAQNSGVVDQVVSIDFIDVNNGIAITQFGPALRTTNGGVNWIPSDTLGYTQKVCFIDSNNAFAAGYEGLIYRTTNGGINWILQNANTTENFLSINFTDANNGIIVGQNGTVLRTSNAGVISGSNSSYSRNGLNLPITDFQNTNDSINVNITDKSTVPIVTRIYLKIDTVLHTNDGDLEFYLEHNGITDTLIYRNGGSGDNFLGTFLNDATNFPLVSGTAPFRGSYKSYRPLSRFNGQNPNGFWKLRIFDRAAGNTGTLEAWSLNITYTQVIGITGNQNTPSEYKLFQNYPNPFNPVTKIKFSLPNGNERNLAVKLKIYDILGREVTTLINQQMKPGSYIAEWNAGNYASGVYFYRLETGDFAETKKMVLVK